MNLSNNRSCRSIFLHCYHNRKGVSLKTSLIQLPSLYHLSSLLAIRTCSKRRCYICLSVQPITFQINHQPDATIFQFIILTLIYSSTCFGRFPVHHQELSDCSGTLWFYLSIVVTVVHLVEYLFELYDDARTYKP
jgi:hypothetical protein